jgi:hypothetical protein
MGLDIKTYWLAVSRNVTLTSELLIESVKSCCCEKWEAESWGRGKFGKLEEGERPTLEAATKRRLVETEKNLCVL